MNVATAPTPDEFLVDRLLATVDAPHDPEHAAEVLYSVARHVYGDHKVATRPKTADEWANVAAAPCPESMRGYRLRQLTGKLLSVGVDPALALALMQSHNLVNNRPPMPPEDVEANVRLIARLQAKELEANG